MGWSLYYSDENGAVKVPQHLEGGTIKLVKDSNGELIAGSDAELSITYNYSKFFPFRELNGKVGEEVLDELEDAVSILGTERDKDYWASTPGNAGHTLNILVQWIKLHPKAVFSIF